MKNVFKFAVASIAATILSSTLTTSTAQSRLTFEGTYVVTGKTPDAAAYSGTMTIVPYGEGYRITQVFGIYTYYGIGTAVGNSSVGDFFAAAFLHENQSSLSLYAVTAANTLSSVWQDYSSTRRGIEQSVLANRSFSGIPSLPAQNNLDYSGTYRVAGTDSGGVAYSNYVYVSRSGSGYIAQRYYANNNTPIFGVGGKLDGFLIFAWNDNGLPRISVYEGNPDVDRKMVGFWQSYDALKRGSESVYPE
jgi:hypothetical protein